MEFSVKILGNSGALPAFGRHPTAQVVNHDDRLFLVDCGEGTQMRCDDFKVKKGRIHHIFISHLHGDHFFGLLGLITSYQLLQRVHPLHIYGPPKLWDIIDLQLSPWGIPPCYELVFHPTQADAPMLLYEDALLTVETIPLNHKIACTGFLFKEKPKERNMRKDQIEKYGIHFTDIPAIKKGGDFKTSDGRIIPNRELTLDPMPPRSYAFCSDTAYNEAMVEQLKGVNLLYHEATFTQEFEERAKKTFHSTAQQAALMAQKVQAQRLLLGHFSAKYPVLDPILKEAKVVFERSSLALEGEVFGVE